MIRVAVRPVAWLSSSRASRAGASMPAAASRDEAARMSAPISLPVMAFSLDLGEFRRLVLGDQRLDHLVERLAGHDLLDLVEGQVDAVIRHAPLRKIIGADPLRPVAGADLALAIGGAGVVERLAFPV